MFHVDELVWRDALGVSGELPPGRGADFRATGKAGGFATTHDHAIYRSNRRNILLPRLSLFAVGAAAAGIASWHRFTKMKRRSRRAMQSWHSKIARHARISIYLPGAGSYQNGDFQFRSAPVRRYFT